jgi:hypothetical protein
LAKRYKTYKLQALDRGGHVLGTSSLFPQGKVRIPFY